jgi:hypothetical protein
MQGYMQVKYFWLNVCDPCLQASSKNHQAVRENDCFKELIASLRQRAVAKKVAMAQGAEAGAAAAVPVAEFAEAG